MSIEQCDKSLFVTILGEMKSMFNQSSLKQISNETATKDLHLPVQFTTIEKEIQVEERLYIVDSVVAESPESTDRILGVSLDNLTLPFGVTDNVSKTSTTQIMKSPKDGNPVPQKVDDNRSTPSVGDDQQINTPKSALKQSKRGRKNDEQTTPTKRVKLQEMPSGASLTDTKEHVVNTLEENELNVGKEKCGKKIKDVASPSKGPKRCSRSQESSYKDEISEGISGEKVVPASDRTESASSQLVAKDVKLKEEQSPVKESRRRLKIQEKFLVETMTSSGKTDINSIEPAVKSSGKVYVKTRESLRVKSQLGLHVVRELFNSEKCEKQIKVYNSIEDSPSKIKEVKSKRTISPVKELAKLTIQEETGITESGKVAVPDPDVENKVQLINKEELPLSKIQVEVVDQENVKEVSTEIDILKFIPSYTNKEIYEVEPETFETINEEVPTVFNQLDLSIKAVSESVNSAPVSTSSMTDIKCEAEGDIVGVDLETQIKSIEINKLQDSVETCLFSESIMECKDLDEAEELIAADSDCRINNIIPDNHESNISTQDNFQTVCETGKPVLRTYSKNKESKTKEATTVTKESKSIITNDDIPEVKADSTDDLKNDVILEEKPRIVLTIRAEKSNMKIVSDKILKKKDKQIDDKEDIIVNHSQNLPGRRSLRLKSNIETGQKRKSDAEILNLKRSPRRRSKEYSDTVLANAIARKEKSYEPVNSAPTRLSRRIKPTAKILANKELRIGVELQNNARLSISNDIHKGKEKQDEKNEKTPEKQKCKSVDNDICSKDACDKNNDVIAKQKTISEKKLRQLKEKHLGILGLRLVENRKNFSVLDVNKAVQESSEDIDSDCKDSRITMQPKKHDLNATEPQAKRSLRDRIKKQNETSTILSSPFKNKSLLPVNTFTNNTDLKHNPNTNANKSDYEDMHTLKPFYCNDIVEQEIKVLPSLSRTNEVLKKDKTCYSDRTVFLTSEAERLDLNASKPESSVTGIVSVESQPLCLCRRKTHVFVSLENQTEPLYCDAVDSIDSRLIGCLHKLNETDSSDPVKEVMLLRPSPRVPFTMMCLFHQERLVRHLCCPACGVFCTEGAFMLCSNKHLYHRECDGSYERMCCPHCADSSNPMEVHINMNTINRLVFLPTRQDHSKPARMSFANPPLENRTKLVLADIETNRPPTPPMLPESTIAVLKQFKPNRDTCANKFTVRDLQKAVRSDDLDKLVQIIASGININQPVKEAFNTTALHIAASLGYLGAVHLLVISGAHMDVLDREQKTPLMAAVLGNHADVVLYFVKAGCDVLLKGIDGMSALHLAAKNGNLEACQSLLFVHNVPRNYINSLDEGGWTPLVWASEHGHLHVVKYLLQQKADPHICDAEQNIVLHWSALSGCSQITEMLLNEGCEVNSTNAHGDTPLHIGARQNNYKCVLILLARGARVDCVNTSGESPLDCCIEASDCYNAIAINMHLQAIVNVQTFNILTNDISNGRETNPIQCVDASLKDSSLPKDFVYVSRISVSSDIQFNTKVSSLQYCQCDHDKCTGLDCLCGNLSLKCWYDEDGKLSEDFDYEDPPMIFECNDACRCNKITCTNRVVQRGMSCRLEVFRGFEDSSGIGWRVRALRLISKGSFVAEYIGELLTEVDADLRSDDSYLFDLDSLDEQSYCIDSRFYGNITRFINHCCVPNLVPVRVFVEHQDLRFPRIAFFASRDIQMHEELGFDYGDKFWMVKYKEFTCLCNKEECKYSKDTIAETVRNYKRKLQEENA